MDDGGRVYDDGIKNPINHEKRKGGNYEPKSPISIEQRQIRSERMKEFNRRTGKNTMQGNLLSRKFRKPK